MGRAFTLSLAWHAAFILSFLLLSGTRAPLRIVDAVRPVRLVTYVEAPRAPALPRAARAPAPAVRAAPAVPPAPPQRAPALPRAAPAAPPVDDAAVEAAAARAALRPVSVPKILVPARPSAPAAQPAPRAAPAEPALGERLSRRLAAATVAAPSTGADEAPRLASLPAAEEPPAPRTSSSVPTALPAPPPGSVVLPIGDFPHAWYLALLKEQIYTRWTPPSEFFSGARGAYALVGLRIDRGGRVSRVALRQGSGSARFDQSALGAVQSLPRVPALPQQYAEESLDVVIRFQNED